MLLRYSCLRCTNTIEKLVKSLDDAIGVTPCLECGAWLERQITAPSSNAVESVDDGITIKPISFDRTRYDLAREQGENILKEKKKDE